MKEKGERESQYATLKGTGIEQLWLSDLAELREEYAKQEDKRRAVIASATSATGGASVKKTVKTVPKAKKQ
jgi:hypothetical protein